MTTPSRRAQASGILQEMLRLAERKYGAEKVAVINEIRRMLVQMTPEQIIAEATAITDPSLLRILIGVGIPGGAYRAVIDHIAKLSQAKK